MGAQTRDSFAGMHHNGALSTSVCRYYTITCCDSFDTGNVLVHNYVRSASAGSTSKQCNRAAVSLWDGNHRHFISVETFWHHISEILKW